MRLFLILFITLFAVGQPSQPPSPTPQKAAHANQSETNPEQQKQTANDQATENLMSAINQLSAEIAARNQQQSSAPDKDDTSTKWWARGNTIAVTLFTGALAVLAYFQWRAMHRQANITDRYTALAEKQSQIADKQREIAAEQLAITKANEARREAERTKEEDAQHIRSQLEDKRYLQQFTIARDNAIAAKGSANAAKISADAFVASQRAWVTVTLAWTPAYEGLFPSSRTDHTDKGETIQVHNATVRMTYRNDGPTPAWITDRNARMEIFRTLPVHPPLEQTEPIDYGLISLAAGEEKYFDCSLECYGETTLDDLVMIYGFVRYRTVIEGVLGQSLFGYNVSYGGHRLRPGSSIEWNNNT